MPTWDHAWPTQNPDRGTPIMSWSCSRSVLGTQQIAPSVSTYGIYIYIYIRSRLRKLALVIRLAPTYSGFCTRSRPNIPIPIQRQICVLNTWYLVPAALHNCIGAECGGVQKLVCWYSENPGIYIGTNNIDLHTFLVVDSAVGIRLNSQSFKVKEPFLGQDTVPWCLQVLQLHWRSLFVQSLCTSGTIIERFNIHNFSFSDLLHCYWDLVKQRSLQNAQLLAKLRIIYLPKESRNDLHLLAGISPEMQEIRCNLEMHPCKVSADVAAALIAD